MWFSKLRGGTLFSRAVTEVLGRNLSHEKRAKKNLVPSDPLISQTRHRHARPEPRNQNRPAISLLLPAALFGSHGSKLPRSPHLRSGWSRRLATAFRSPATAALSGSHYGIDVPGLMLRHLAKLSSGPFGLWLLRSPRFAPVWAGSTPQARFQIPVLQS